MGRRSAQVRDADRPLDSGSLAEHVREAIGERFDSALDQVGHLLMREEIAAMRIRNLVSTALRCELQEQPDPPGVRSRWNGIAGERRVSGELLHLFVIHADDEVCGGDPLRRSPGGAIDKFESASSRRHSHHSRWALPDLHLPKGGRLHRHLGVESPAIESSPQECFGDRTAAVVGRADEQHAERRPLAIARKLLGAGA
jgi:hypothetical protein